MYMDCRILKENIKISAFMMCLIDSCKIPYYVVIRASVITYTLFRNILNTLLSFVITDNYCEYL